MNFSKIIGTAAVIGMLVLIYNQYQDNKKKTNPVKIK